MQAAFVHQRARHHTIVHEMTSQEPIVRADVRLADDLTQSKPPAARIEPHDAMDEVHPTTWQTGRLFERQADENIAKASSQIPAAKGVDLRVVVGLDAGQRR